MLKRIRRLADKIGVDGAIAITILTRVFQAGGGLLSIFLVARYLTTNEQGYYYTFGSILGIQVFFELGLSNILTQYAAHECAYLNIMDLQITGDEYYRSRLASLLHFCVKTFSIISFILFWVLLASGFYFFSTFNNSAAVTWKLPWVVLCLTTSLNLFIDPLLAFFDGLGKVKDMAMVRLIQKCSYIIFAFVFFMLGCKLYSAALASLLSILVNYAQVLFTDRYKLLKVVWSQKGKEVIDYVKEIFPFQWRIALSWISGYFIFSLFNPVLFATDGAKVAGQMGMTLAALMGITTLTLSWINTKVPLFSGLIAKKQYEELDRVFNRTIKQIFGVTVFLTGVLLIFVYILRKFQLHLGERFLPFFPLVLLCITVIVNQFVFAWAAYLRCHKEEPFLIQSIVVGALCCISTFFLGHKFGLYGMVGGYTFIMVVISFIWGYVVFRTKRKEWHTTAVS